jgi:hypothetical protein
MVRPGVFMGFEASLSGYKLVTSVSAARRAQG